MSDDEIVSAYVRYFMGGADADCEAGPIELSQIAIRDPERAWVIIQRINATPIEDKTWREHLQSGIGCGALEALMVLHEGKMLPVILAAAAGDPVLRFELSTIYETSVSPGAWKRIRTALDR